ncbi:MAG TPA: class I SAM-dependent methyltransferase [Candidatus Dormibacteraeota bacterium]|nr:class I SAM-dependent methyltransferase [Candidatus Dormibacteraeota bacterium]
MASLLRTSLFRFVPYDPSLFRGTATHYVRGRPAYSRELGATLEAELSLDGTGRLLDAGCGPGVLVVQLAPHFAEAVGLDPDADMLEQAAARAAAAGIANVRWVHAVAEDIGRLGLGTFRLVTFGQSFHWTDRERVAEMVYELLEPGGALAVIDHAHAGRPEPPAPEHPPIPHGAIRALIASYLGERQRAGQGFAPERPERNQDAIARTRFGRPKQVFARGREDVVQDAEGVLSNYLSTSFCAPHLFGDRLAAFEADARAALAASSPTGLFWDWPGDTEVLVARKG